MVSLTFYGGAGEIGGNKILLEDGDARIFLDFGMGFSASARFYSEFLGPKKCNGIGDYVELGLVPDLAGLYREDYIKKMGRLPEEKAFDGVLLSHAHFDHLGYFNLLRPDINVYCSQASRCVMDMLDTTGNTGEFLREKVSFCFVPKKRGEGVKRLDSRDPEGTIERSVNVVDKCFNVGGLYVTPIPVDHSLPGALAYAIETREGTIIYSGDFRFHGLNRDASEGFLEKASSFDPVAMICEGTRIEADTNENENDVYEAVSSFTHETESLVIANYPVRDTDRMTSFHKAAQENERRLVVNMRQAYLLKKLEENGIPAPRLDDVSIYIPRKSWGLLTEDAERELVYGDYDKWEMEFLDSKNAVNCSDVGANQDEYVWRCDFFELKEIIDVKPGSGSRYVWSVTEPFDVKMEMNEQIIRNWLDHYNVKGIYRKHVSGHAGRSDLVRAIKSIGPETLIPMHTEHPELFGRVHDRVIVPVTGERILI